MMNKLFDKSSKLRNLKESVVGVEKIKDDPFGSDRIELEEYEKVLRTMRSAVDNYSSHLHDLNQIHLEMTRSVKKFYELSDDIQERHNVDSLVEGIRSVADDFDHNKETLTRVVTRLDALLLMHTGLGERLRERDKAHAMKLHYEEKVASIKDTKSAEKIDRNNKKQQEAVAEYEKIEEQAIRECRDALNTKYKDLDQVLGLYLKFFVDYHGTVGSKFTKMSGVVDQLMISQKKAVVENSRSSSEEENAGPSNSANTSAKQAAVAEKLKQQLTANSREHDEMRDALGLRLKKNTASPPVVDENDNDSDLE
jgi:hypothetical protein